MEEVDGGEDIHTVLSSELKSMKADIVFLQETHFDKEGNFKYVQRLYPMVFLASQE